MVVDAYPMEIVKLEVVAVAPFASVTVTDTVDVPAIAGVPEIVPVELFKLKPLNRDPFNECVRFVRPPDATTARENPLSTVPDKPDEGVVMDSAPATVNVAVVEVLEVETPLLMVLVTTAV